MSSYYTSSSSSDDSSDVDDKMENLNLVEKNEVNILLIGGTGVGKSTFINAMANYISIKFFHDAEKIGMVKLIPTAFKIQDKYKKEHEIKIGPKKDANECLKIGESATQNVKTYVFPAWEGKGRIRLIDTPGMGDTRGIEKDEQNCENIINYVKKIGKLHAICFLCKPTETRRTVYFDYCIYMILSHFEKDIAKNLFFIFTNTRGSNYSPGDTLSILKIIIKNIQDISGLKIDLKNRIYCFDNEGFRFLAALENKIEFDQAARDKFIKSWQHSAKQCWRLIKHLRYDVKPYIPAKLTEVNLAKKLLLQFSKSLVEISQSVQDNQNILVRVRDNKTRELNSITELKSQKTTVTDVIQTKMSQPMLVCTSVPSCAQVYRVRGEDKWHYAKMCHACYEVGNDIRTFTVGCPDIINCNMINGVTRKCNQCGCDFLLHMYIDYVTSLKEDLLLDDDVSHRIATRESLLSNCDEIVDDINEQNVLFQSEYDIIKLCCMNLSRYIKGHSILAFSDSYKEYIVYLINQQKSTSSSSIKTSIESLNKLKQQYIEAELAFKEALKSPVVSRKDVNFDMSDVHFQNLFTLKNKGKELSDIYHYQKKIVSQDCQIQEYVHDHYFKNNKKNPKKDNRNRRDRKNRSTQNLAANYPERPDSRSSTSSYHSTRSDNRNVHEHNKGYHQHPPNFNQNYSQHYGGQPNPRYPPPNFHYTDPRNHPRGHQDSYNLNLTVNRNPSHFGTNYPPSQQHYPPPQQQYPQSQQYPHPQYPSQQQYGYPPQGAYGYTPPPPNQYPEQHRGQNHAYHSRGRSASRGRYNKNETSRRSEGNTRGRNATRGDIKDFARAKSGDRYNKDEDTNQELTEIRKHGMRKSDSGAAKNKGTDIDRRGNNLQKSNSKNDSGTGTELENSQKHKGELRTRDRSDSGRRNGPFRRRGINRISYSRNRIIYSRSRLHENHQNNLQKSNTKDHSEADPDNETKNNQNREGRSKSRNRRRRRRTGPEAKKLEPRSFRGRGINTTSSSRGRTPTGSNENQSNNDKKSNKKEILETDTNNVLKNNQNRERRSKSRDRSDSRTRTGPEAKNHKRRSFQGRIIYRTSRPRFRTPKGSHKNQRIDAQESNSKHVLQADPNNALKNNQKREGRSKSRNENDLGTRHEPKDIINERRPFNRISHSRIGSNDNQANKIQESNSNDILQADTDKGLKNNQKPEERSRTIDRSGSGTRHGHEGIQHDLRAFKIFGMDTVIRSRSGLNEIQRNNPLESNTKDILKADTDNALKNNQKPEERSRTRDRSGSGTRYRLEGIQHDLRRFERFGMNRISHSRSGLNENQRNNPQESNSEEILKALKNNENREKRSKTRDKNDSGIRYEPEDVIHECRPFERTGMNRISDSRSGLNKNKRNNAKESNSKDILKGDADNELENNQKHEGRSKTKDRSEPRTRNEPEGLKYKPRTFVRHTISHSRENEQESNSKNRPETATKKLEVGVDAVTQISDNLEEISSKKIPQSDTFSKIKRFFLSTFGKK